MADALLVCGVRFRFSYSWGDGRARWVAQGGTILERTTRGNWFVYTTGATRLYKYPEDALTEARRKALNKEARRHERELKRIARELGADEVSNG